MAPYRFKGEERSCELCGSTGYDVVGTRDRYLHPLRTVLCHGCGLVFTNPMPTEPELEVFYGTAYRKTATPWRKHILRNHERALQRYRFLHPLLTDAGTVLDVGSGGGEFLRLLGEAGHRAIGIEPDRGVAAFAERQYGVSVQKTGWADADVAQRSVDLITVHQVVEHLRHPLVALRRFHEWLKPGGRLYVSVPDIEDPGRTPISRFHFAHLFNFNRTSLVLMCHKAGFEPDPRFVTDSTTLVCGKRQTIVEEERHLEAIGRENHRRMATFFETYTNRRHFLSPSPYTRWWHRMVALGKSTLLARFRRLPWESSENGAGRSR